MPAPDEGAARVLEALPEPALLVGAPGRIAFANRAALARLGPGAQAGEDLAALCPDAEAGAALRHYLLRCSGSRECERERTILPAPPRPMASYSP